VIGAEEGDFNAAHDGRRRAAERALLMAIGMARSPKRNEVVIYTWGSRIRME
jgi:hypothetical protein